MKTNFNTINRQRATAMRATGATPVIKIGHKTTVRSLVRRLFRKSPRDQKASAGFYVLIVLSWIASVVSLRIYLNALIGAALSAGPSLHATAGDLLMLASCPVIATAAIVFAFILRKVTIWRFVLVFLPGLLSLAELVFTFIVWSEG